MQLNETVRIMHFYHLSLPVCKVLVLVQDSDQFGSGAT